MTTEDGNKYAGYKNIIGYLKSLDFTLPDPTNNLSDDSHVELLRQNLHPYYMYSQWCQASQDYSRALYAVRIRFPYNFITPRDYFERTDDLMQTYYKFSLEDPVNSHDIAQMALKAKQTLNMLELKLSKSKWAGGSTPSILDAHVYAYIALIAKNNLPYNSLQVHVKQCPNLLRYVEDFTQAYLSKDGYSSEQKSSSDEKRKEEEPKSTFSTGQDEEDNPKDIRKRYLLSALVATISMLTYSIMKGIVSVSRKLKIIIGARYSIQVFVFL